MELKTLKLPTYDYSDGYVYDSANAFAHARNGK